MKKVFWLVLTAMMVMGGCGKQEDSWDPWLTEFESARDAYVEQAAQVKSGEKDRVDEQVRQDLQRMGREIPKMQQELAPEERERFAADIKPVSQAIIDLNDPQISPMYKSIQDQVDALAKNLEEMAEEVNKALEETGRDMEKMEAEVNKKLDETSKEIESASKELESNLSNEAKKMENAVNETMDSVNDALGSIFN